MEYYFNIEIYISKINVVLLLHIIIIYYKINDNENNIYKVYNIKIE